MMNELGVYIEPATTEDAIRALADHTPGEWVMELANPNGELLWRKRGWSWNLVEDNDEAMFAVALREQHGGNPSMYADAPLVLSFVKGSMEMSGDCDLYSGGLVFRFGFRRLQGPHADDDRLAQPHARDGDG
jgi:hypothetical protein